MSPAALRALYGPTAIWESTGFLLRSLFTPSPGAPVVMLSADPVVFFGRVWALRPGAPMWKLLDEVSRRHVDFICCLSSNYDTARQAGRLARLQRRVQRNPLHRFPVMANTPGQQDRFAGLGIESFYVSELCHADDSIYRPLEAKTPEFDAIYDASLLPVKRHQLAAAVPNLALVTNLTDAPIPRRYGRLISGVLDRAHILNGLPGTGAHRSLTPAEVNGCLNRAAVGLCLSAEEGAMRASIQYLLAGLPVVSTPSVGGRDVMFDPDYVAIVDPTAEAVARGVSEMRDRRLDPAEIRSRTLARVQPHRERFRERLEQIFRERGSKRAFDGNWSEMFGNSLHLTASLDIEAALRSIESSKTASGNAPA